MEHEKKLESYRDLYGIIIKMMVSFFPRKCGIRTSNRPPHMLLVISRAPCFLVLGSFNPLTMTQASPPGNRITKMGFGFRVEGLCTNNSKRNSNNNGNHTRKNNQW